VSLTKTYRFSAGHRLYIKELSEEENFRIFDTCSNPNGHGHDYYVHVKVAGDIDPKSVMKDVLRGFDHKHLNDDNPHFKDLVPTTENIAPFITSFGST